MNDSNHPSSHDIRQYAIGHMDPTASRAIRDHVRECHECAHSAAVEIRERDERRYIAIGFALAFGLAECRHDAAEATMQVLAEMQSDLAVRLGRDPVTKMKVR
jgi:hypothetical protein